MLTIHIEKKELFNDKLSEFETIEASTLCLEHSLVSISKWESKWHKPFINTKEKTTEELIDYVKCMTLTQNVNPKIYSTLSIENTKKINAYIADPMTATIFNDNTKQEGSKPKKEDIITSELIYFWMTSYQIPFGCEKWHLNRLLALIKICSIKNSGGKEAKLSKRQTMANNRALNLARRQALHSKG